MSAPTPATVSCILGRSAQGRPIEGVFFGSEAPPFLDTLLVGAFHGDEGISTDILRRLIALWQAGQFFESGPPDFQAKPTLIVPALNPDGLAVRTRVNANGVDLNRNYPTPNWKKNEPGPYYCGPSAGSEPETRFMTDLIARYAPRKIISVHSPYRVVNLDGPARALAEAMAEKAGYPVVESIGYPTPGSFGHYAGILLGIPVITLELPPGPDDPPDPEYPATESAESIWQSVGPALEAALRFECCD